MSTSRVPSILLPLVAAVTAISLAAAPCTAAAETQLGARVTFSFGSGENALSLGLGVHEERTPALGNRRQPLAERSLVRRPAVELSARFTGPGGRFEGLRLNGLRIGAPVLRAEEAEGGEEAGSRGRDIGVGIALGAAAVLVLAYVVADDIQDEVLKSIED